MQLVILLKKKFKGSLSIIIAADEETTGLGTPAVMKYLKNKKKNRFYYSW